MLHLTKKIINRIAAFSASVLMVSCQDSGIQDRREKTSVKRQSSDAAIEVAKATKIKLTWQEQSHVVTIYHVFYNKNQSSNVGGEEIDSINAKEHDLSQPEVTIDKSNIAAFPAKGSTLCFYIVAENEGSMSPPSNAACTTI